MTLALRIPDFDSWYVRTDVRTGRIKSPTFFPCPCNPKSATETILDLDDGPAVLGVWTLIQAYAMREWRRGGWLISKDREPLSTRRIARAIGLLDRVDLVARTIEVVSARSVGWLIQDVIQDEIQDDEQDDEQDQPPIQDGVQDESGSDPVRTRDVIATIERERELRGGAPLTLLSARQNTSSPERAACAQNDDLESNGSPIGVIGEAERGGRGAKPLDAAIVPDNLEARLLAWEIERKNVTTILGSCKPRRVRQVLDLAGEKVSELDRPGGWIVRLLLDSSKPEELTQIGRANGNIRAQRRAQFRKAAEA